MLTYKGFHLSEKTFEVTVEQAYAGRYATSQEMAGFSLTLMILDDLVARCLGMEVTFFTEYAL